MTRLALTTIFLMGVFSRPSYGQIHVRIYEGDIGFDAQTDFVYNTVSNGAFDLQKEYLYKCADSGQITYNIAKKRLDGYKQRWAEVSKCLELNKISYIFLAYSLTKNSDGWKIPEYYYDINGIGHKLDTPEELIEFLAFQQRIKRYYLDNNVVSAVKTQYTDEIRYDCLVTFVTKLIFLKEEQELVNDKIYTIPVESHREKKIKFLIEPFPNFQHEVLISKSFFKKGADPSYTSITINNHLEYSLKYIKLLHNNSFLDFSRDIQEIEKKIDVQDTEHEYR